MKGTIRQDLGFEVKNPDNDIVRAVDRSIGQAAHPWVTLKGAIDVSVDHLVLRLTTTARELDSSWTLEGNWTVRLDQ